MPPQLEIQIIAVIVAAACSLPGVFLVLRNLSMMSDSITHTILLGIVMAFFVTRDLSSPLLILGAALMGVATVWLTELLNKTRLVSEDSAIGIVFPLLFSIAVILIARHAGSIHLDTDSVLLGELAFAPFERMVVAGVDLGAKAIYTSGALLLINLGVIVLLFKELKVVTFDPMLAAVLGFSPVLVHYGLMTLVSLTAVGTFEAVGSVLVVSFLIGPPVTAYLLTDNLRHMLLLSAGTGVLSALTGYPLASALDVSIAGAMAGMVGLIFLLTFLFAPKRGWIGILLRKRNRRTEFAKKALLLSLYRRTNGPVKARKADVDALRKGLGWDEQRIHDILDRLRRDDCIQTANGGVTLTPKGRRVSLAIYREFSLTE